MHSLFVRIFVLFWFAMALIVGGSIAITFMIAAREYDSADAQRRPNVAIEASEVLSKGGLVALSKWLGNTKSSLGDRDIFIIGPDGRDILMRRLSDSAKRRLDYFNRNAASGFEPRFGGSDPPLPPPPGNFRPPRFAPQIVGHDGAAYTVLIVPRRPMIFGALSLPGISLTILGIALAVSALTSWWLAQHLSAPIRRIQEGARTLAAVNSDLRTPVIRVSAGLENRKDELAVLARDFDAMADQLRANRTAITQLLRDISHELRSPLARMRVAVGLGRRPVTDLGLQLDRLEREIERLDALITQVLKLARLHSSDAAFDQEAFRDAFDVDEVIDEVVCDANFEGAAKGCTVVRTGSTEVSMQGDRELLRSAVENVLRNAVRYSPSGLPVDVALVYEAAGLSISVRDHGPGVPASDLERIFEPFYRVAEARDRDSGGDGIGLAITARVFKNHGGSAQAVNKPDGGLEVYLRLPRSILSRGAKIVEPISRGL